MSHSAADIRRQHAAYEANDKVSFGFWLYIMTDCVLFASLFATFAVLRTSTFGGPGAGELFSLPYILVETLLLLTSSFTCGLAMLALQNQQVSRMRQWFVVTALLGLVFVGMEISEFHHLVLEGNSWRRSGFLSAYFTLVGTHGLHISVGLIWLCTLLKQSGSRSLNAAAVRRFGLFSIFWHFLDIIWIFIFTVVYLLGAV